jgi:hypothetical protein
MPSPRARRSAVCFVIAISLLIPTILSAQGASGRILGRVADPTGAVLAAVKITLLNEATGISRGAQTNDNGDYSFVEVAPGTYTVQFELTGFKKNVQKEVIVDVNQVVTLNSTLQIGGSQETVEVTSEAPQVDTTSTHGERTAPEHPRYLPVLAASARCSGPTGIKRQLVRGLR